MNISKPNKKITIPELIEQGLLKRTETYDYWKYNPFQRWVLLTKAHLRYLFGFRFWEEDLLEELKDATSNLSQRNPSKFKELFESCGKAEYQEYIIAMRNKRDINSFLLDSNKIYNEDEYR